MEAKTAVIHAITSLHAYLALKFTTRTSVPDHMPLLCGKAAEDMGHTKSDGGKNGVGRLLLDAKWLCTCMWRMIM